LISHTKHIDYLLNLSNSLITHQLKAFFGLGNITQDVDFVNALTIPLGSFQAKNWDDRLSSPTFDVFCDIVGRNGTGELGGGLEEQNNFGRRNQMIFGGTSNRHDPAEEFIKFSTYARYIRDNIAGLCPPEMSQDECFGSSNEVGEDGEDSDIGSFKSWTYQVCTGTFTFRLMISLLTLYV
jgi:hypothetical protein